jgi:hypothetical protein
VLFNSFFFFSDASFKKIPVISGSHPSVNAMRGIFGLGNQLADDRAADWITKGKGASPTEKVVIFGHGDAACAALGGILSLGVAPERIVWLCPNGESAIDLGHNDVILMLCFSRVLSLKVKTFIFRFLSWRTTR